MSLRKYIPIFFFADRNHNSHVTVAAPGSVLRVMSDRGGFCNLVWISTCILVWTSALGLFPYSSLRLRQKKNQKKNQQLRVSISSAIDWVHRPPSMHCIIRNWGFTPPKLNLTTNNTASKTRRNRHASEGGQGLRRPRAVGFQFISIQLMQAPSLWRGNIVKCRRHRYSHSQASIPHCTVSNGLC